mmetsp:Transcript_16007/g.55914  ORF Transcript_16007/g.55914 Transcript_16007/m.55914 type:complete len:253 (-) Transcript_16007:742-1500(-)
MRASPPLCRPWRSPSRRRHFRCASSTRRASATCYCAAGRRRGRWRECLATSASRRPTSPRAEQSSSGRISFGQRPSSSSAATRQRLAGQTSRRLRYSTSNRLHVALRASTRVWRFREPMVRTRGFLFAGAFAGDELRVVLHLYGEGGAGEARGVVDDGFEVFGRGWVGRSDFRAAVCEGHEDDQLIRRVLVDPPFHGAEGRSKARNGARCGALDVVIVEQGICADPRPGRRSQAKVDPARGFELPPALLLVR